MRPRVAVLGITDSVPWLPLFGGVVCALRAHGCDVRLIHASPRGDASLEELREHLEQAGADPSSSGRGVLLVLPEHAAAGLVRPYMAAAREAGAAVGLVTLDDPYDIATGLALAPAADFVATPEPFAAESYERAVARVAVVPPLIDPRMHYRPPPERLGALPAHDVAFIGQTDYPPRRAFLPRLRAALATAGRSYGEAAGRGRWVHGRQLTELLWSVGVLLELPRCEAAVRTNPELLPCTYTGPRVHIAAACGAFVLGVDPRPDFSELFPEFPSCRLADGAEAAVYWSAPERTAERRERAAAAAERWQRWRATPAAELAGLVIAAAQTR